MINYYLHICPRVFKNYFKDNEVAIAATMEEEYAEIVSMAQILDIETYLLLTLNFAFELD
jgi:hypothetical protein